ncbi:MAG: Ig-like domain-containing protein, partial [Chloroflexota bacterium]|nr:Ig-like domain-containing protein [Chloroflexota bacterium]
TTAPTVTINQAVGQTDPTLNIPINFTVVFNEPVSGFVSGDVSLSGTAGATTASVTESAPNNGTTYNVAVSGMTTNGTVIADIAASAASDAGGNGNAASTSSDNTVTFVADSTAPSVALSSAAPDPTNTSPIPVTAQFSENVLGFTASDIGASNATLSNFVAVDGDTYTFDLVPGGQGLVTADIAAGVAQDAVGNPNTAATQFSRTFDTSAPETTIDRGPANPSLSTVTFNFSSSEANSTFACSVDNAAFTGCTNPQTYTGLADGTHTLAVRAIDAAGNVDATPATYTWRVDTTTPDILVSANGDGTVAGIAYRDEDMLSYDPDTGQWALVFDGSDVGLSTTDLDDFVFLPGGDILLSIDKDITLAGLGAVGDEDVLRFTPTRLGSTTTGSYALYLDGSAVGLEANNDNEDIRGLDIDANGELVISVLGAFKALGVTGGDEDLFVFHHTSLGNTTVGTWELRFDGSDIDLTSAAEDIRSVWQDPASGDLHLTTDGSFAIAGTNGLLSGDANDIIRCFGPTFGATSTCATVSLLRDLSELGNRRIDGLHISNLPSTYVPLNAPISAADVDPAAVPGDDADEADPDPSQDEEQAQSQQLFLPLVNR